MSAQDSTDGGGVGNREELVCMSVLSDAIARRGDPSSIAIVGNSPKIIEREDGPLIDSHGTIIRINDGRSSGFEKHCGSRTDIRFVGVPLKERYRAFFSSLDEPSLIITRKGNRRVLEELNYQGKAVYIKDYAACVLAALPILSEFVPSLSVHPNPPRSGLVIVSMLSPFFNIRKISLFGFEMESRSLGMEHYYDDGRSFESVVSNWKGHCPMGVEFDLLKNLNDIGLISVYQA